MIDVTKLPFPDDAPEPGTCVRIERPEPGLAVLVLDPPHRSLAVLDGPLIRDLDAAVSELEQDGSLQGVVIAGRAPDQFAAGADVKAIGALTDPSVFEELVHAVHGIFARIERLKAFTVAAVGGPVPGGAYELALTCDRIVATDDPKTRIGLPETQLGIVPGWGGSHRLPRRVGVPLALQAVLTGKLYPAKQAKKLGLVDRVTKPEYLRRIAADIALKRVRVPRARRGTLGVIMDRVLRPIVAGQARKQVLAKTRGHYPAALAAIDLVTRAPGVSPARFAAREAPVVARLATGPVCKSLVLIFLGMEDQKRLGRAVEGARGIGRVGVLGAGVMGGGIASLSAQKGLPARLMDLSAEALDLAQLAHRAEVAKKLKRRRLESHEAAAAVDRLEVTERIAGFQRCDLVVEAVAERLDVKRRVLDELAHQVDEDAILATNTSSLSVDAIAEGVPYPERVCGMHFFNPVAKMPLVEIVRGAHTSDQTVAAVAALAVKLGKTPVVCRDVAGFLVNRILGPYLDEAVRLFDEGADVARVDRLMLEFGMPMGPFRLLDEVGLDIARHAAASLHAAYGLRMTPSDVLERLATPERLGRKTGRGFYVHSKDRKAKVVPADDLSSFRSGSRSHDDAEIVDRLVLSMVNEAARCREEEVVASAAELDLATVLGTGFAPFRGGVLRYADARGLTEVVARLGALAALPTVAERTGGTVKFKPAALLDRLAEDAETFHAAAAVRPVSSPA